MGSLSYEKIQTGVIVGIFQILVVCIVFTYISEAGNETSQVGPKGVCLIRAYVSSSIMFHLLFQFTLSCIIILESTPSSSPHSRPRQRGIRREENTEGAGQPSAVIHMFSLVVSSNNLLSSLCIPVIGQNLPMSPKRFPDGI